jgi:hypothetical protein
MEGEKKETSVQKGIYRHFKGREYLLIEIVNHSETLEKMVVYQALYGDFSYWVRPFDLFFEKVQVEGEWVSRFEFIKKQD